MCPAVTTALRQFGLYPSQASTGDIIEIQGTYDPVVDQVGCSDSTDSLMCLRLITADD